MRRSRVIARLRARAVAGRSTAASSLPSGRCRRNEIRSLRYCGQVPETGVVVDRTSWDHLDIPESSELRVNVCSILSSARSSCGRFLRQSSSVRSGADRTDQWSGWPVVPRDLAWHCQTEAVKPEYLDEAACRACRRKAAHHVELHIRPSANRELGTRGSASLPGPRRPSSVRCR